MGREAAGGRPDRSAPGHPPDTAAARPGVGLVALGLPWSLGAGSFYLVPQVPPAWLGWWLGLGVLALALLAMRLRGRLGGGFWDRDGAGPRRPLRALAAPGLALAAAVLAGFLYAQLRTGPLLWSPFPDDLARVPLIVEGRIVSIPADTGFARRFIFRVERTQRDAPDQASQGPLPFRGLVRLSWYDGAPDLKAGERWRLPVRLKPRHGFANPGGFDYERWLFEQGIAATGGLRKGDEAPRRLDPGPGPAWLDRLRQGIAEHLAQVLGDSRALGLVQALAIGERSGLSPDDWEVLTRTGTNHLVAISGLHVGLVAGLAFPIVRRLWSLWPPLALRVPAPRAAALAGGLAALVYAGLAGFAVSTQRALIMLAVVLGAVVWQRALRPWHAFSLAVVGVVALDPRAVLSYGTWLSFGAVAVLLFNLGGRLPSRDLWTRFGRAQWAVGLGLLPLLLLLFGRASLVAPLVNLVAVPLFGVALLPMVLVAVPLSYVPGLDLPLVWTGEVLDRSLLGLERLAAAPWATGTLAERPAWAWAAAFLGVALLLAPRGLPGRWTAGLALLLPVALLRPPAPAPGAVWLTLLDVGQGLSAVVRTAAGTLVYDTGPGYDSGFDTGSLVVAPFLAAQGVGKVDVLVLSHGDRDHAGGAAGLLARLPAGRILSGEPSDIALPGVEPCRAGDGWAWSGVRFELLHPQADGLATGNDASCVLRVTAAGRSLLLPGDIGKAVESRLAERLGAGLKSDVLVAGHHGSNTSTSEVFLDAVDPQLVLYAAGFANHFGFPARAVRERVAARHIRSLSTASEGAIELRLDSAGSIEGPFGQRERAGRMWTHRPGADPSPDL